MTPELEVLDLLLGGDLPLNVIADLFPEQNRCRRAIGVMLGDGEISIFDPAGRPILAWRYRELKCEPDFWAEGTPYRMSITEVGARRMT